MKDLELADWRRHVAEIYANVRAHDDAEAGHAMWRTGRDELYRSHPQSPLGPDDPLRRTGLPHWPYDPTLRFVLPVLVVPDQRPLLIPTGDDGTTSLGCIGRLHLPPPLDVSIDVWRLQQYGGGLFVPLRDGTAGETSYGGGRYVLDTAKGADLGGDNDSLVIDLNFAYHPSCRYSSSWICPLAPAGNIISKPVRAGERL